MQFIRNILFNFASLDKMMKKKKIWFLVNPISGTENKKRIVDMIPKYMNSDNFEITVLHTEYKGHAAVLSREAVFKSVDVVVAGSAVFCAENPEGALQVLNECIIQELDYGRINDTPFFCTCGVGFDAFVSSKFANSSKRGLRSYIESTLIEGLKYKPETYEIEVDGEDGTTEKYNAFLIACANASQYGNNVYIAPTASMSDGLMDVTIMQPFTMLEAPQIAIQLFNKTILQNSHIRTFRCRRLTIHRSHPGVIHFDGDPKDEVADLEIELYPHDIRMVVNTNEQPSLPPLLRMFNDLYNDMNEEFTQIKDDIKKTPRRIRVINKELLRKLKS